MARVGSGKTVKSRDAINASNRASAQGRCKTLTHSKRQFESLIAEARSRAQRNWFSDRSTPVTEIWGNGWASRREYKPGPQPNSINSVPDIGRPLGQSAAIIRLVSSRKGC